MTRDHQWGYRLLALVLLVGCDRAAAMGAAAGLPGECYAPSHFWIYGPLLLAALATGVVLALRLRSAKREMEQQIKNARTLFDHNGSGHLIVSSVRDILDVNRQFCAMFGYERDELIGKSASVLHLDQGYYERWAPRFQEARGGMAMGSADYPWRRKDGSILWCAFTGVRLTLPDGNPGVVWSVIDITERKQAQEKLEKEKAFLRTMIDAIPDLIFFKDRNGLYLGCNKAFADYLGRPKDEIVGRNDSELQHTAYLAARCRATDRQVIEAGKAITVEMDLTAADGHNIQVESLKVPFFDGTGAVDGLIGIGRDITERKKAENELKLTRFTVEHAADAVFWIQSDAFIVDVNEAACRSLGYPREELLTLRVPDVDLLYNAEVWPAHWAELKEKKSLTFESLQKHRGGEPFPVEISANYIQFGDLELNCAIVRDISERKRDEEVRKNLEQQMLHAQKLESLGVLAGGIAHDFNNILTTIVGNAELALMRLNPESPILENIRLIETAAARASDLAKQMLAYSGKGRFVIESIDLNRLVEEMGNMLEVSISKKATLRYNLASELSPVDVDATQIRQIIMNLVINASEAIGDRSGIIAISTGSQECSETYLQEAWLTDPIPEGHYVYLEVSDTGAGMSRETLGKIFDPFFTTKFTGRGLGMAAVLGIIRGHKGSIKVYSELGKGSSFKVLIPAGTMPEKVPNDCGPGVSWKGGGVALLVDDEETVLGVGEEMLKELGFEVLTAGNGREALEVFQSRDDICLVILDLTMPRMDGEQCFRELRSLDPKVRVIMSSGFSEHEVTEKFVGKGIAGFIEKPYKLSTLREVICRSENG